MSDDPAAREAQRHALIRDFAANRWEAHQILFSHRHPDESCEAHHEIVKLIYGPSARQGIEGFRGIAKSTLLEEAAIIKKCYREFRNMVIVSASYSRAVDRLASIKREFELNWRLLELFGDQKGTTWQEGKIVFNDGSCIQALGRDQSMTGIKHLDWRPDAALIDDVEDADEVRSDAEREDTWDWFMKTFLPSLDDPVHSWVRVLGTRRGKGSLLERIETESGWPVAKFPIEHPDPVTGKRVATWASKFWLEKIDELRLLYRGKMDTFAEEYMCEATHAASRVFRAAMFQVVPRVPRWEAVYGFIDPASSVNRLSATTGWAVWSWVGSRLIVWDAGAERMLPDQITKLAFRLVVDFPNLVWLGHEVDALNQFLMQPLRLEQIRRGLAFIPFKPIRAISATKGRGKISFIEGLQQFYSAGEVEHAKPLPDLEAQLMSFPYPPIDVPNALAYAQLMRPGLLVFDNFDEENVVESLEPAPDKPLFLAGNADKGVVTAVLLQRAGGELRIFADWIVEGAPSDLISDIHAEASLMAETGRWEVHDELGDPDQPYKMPIRREVWARLPLRWIVPAWHRETWQNVGLMQAIRAIPQGVSAAEGGAERGRPALAAMLSQHQKGRPKVLVSPNARWTLRSLTGGYARAIGRGGVADAQPEPGIYRTLMEGIEAFCAVGAAIEQQSDSPNQQPVAYDRRGVPYASAMPARGR